MENTSFFTKGYVEDPASEETNLIENLSEQTLAKGVVKDRGFGSLQDTSEPSSPSKTNSDLSKKKNNYFENVTVNTMQDYGAVYDVHMTVEEPVLCRIFSTLECESNNQNKNTNSINPCLFDTVDDREILPKVSLSRIDSRKVHFITQNRPTSNYEKDILGLRLQTTGEFGYYRDAWIPSKRTITAFMKTISETDDSELFTKPSLSSGDLITDMAGEGAYHELKNVDTVCGKNLSIKNVIEDEHGLRELIQTEKYQSAVNLTGILLTKLGQGVGKAGVKSKHTEFSIQLWFTRLALLVKLGELRTADVEASVWWDCDRPDLYYQFYPELYKGRVGTMIPFQMRLLLAVLPGHCGCHSEALQRLFSMLAVTRKILENLTRGCCEDGSQLERSVDDCAESLKLWTARHKRILISIVNVAVEMQDFLLAIDVMNKLLENEDSREAKQVLYSVLGRIHLRLGDIQEADKYFKLARGLNIVTKDLDVEYNVSKALMAVADNNYQDAYTFFERASLIDPSSIMVMNNCAVCLLFMKHLKEAIRLLTGTIANNPYKALQNALVLNLCSLFELEGSYDWNKKLDLLRFIHRFKESITTTSLKLK